MNRLKTSFISHVRSLKSLQQPVILRRNLAAPTYLAFGSSAPSKLPKSPTFSTHLRSFSTDRCQDIRGEGRKVIHEKTKAVNTLKQRMVEAKQSGEYEKQKEAIINKFRVEAAEIRANWDSKLKMNEDSLLEALTECRKCTLAFLEDWEEMEVKISVAKAEKKGYEKEKEVEALYLRIQEQSASHTSKMISKSKEIVGGDSEEFKTMFERLCGTSAFEPESSLVVDAMALWNSIRQAKKLGFSKVTIESDNKILVDCVNGNQDFIPWEIYPIVQEIKSRLASNPQFDVVLKRL
ncbi:hypothetical protein SLEP1_g10443 [Rubroshorea leprosula]|uniref:RNase H type-1 domain-containing protein n=1 Tax=Rubroshorea leprosula TaxID=152421 RepID=A0AAV5IDU1_9ROSI|nr:hypothetical protein SLEP1_g10443 [Rubroshorea leprosula]